MKNGIFLAACVALFGALHSAALAQNPGGNLPLGQPVQQQMQPQQRQMLPAPFQITQPEAEYIDRILGFWEFRSGKVHHYEAQFKRWEYDSTFGPADQHKTYSEGVVKYEQPDKGMFQVNKILHWTAPKEQGQQPTYEERAGEVMEHWVCDGKTIFEFDVAQKKLKEYPLPPEQQGQAITNGPLPFLFGAKKQEIQERFYLRVSTPKEVSDQYWLEAWPKYPEDAANYRFIEIIIDQQEFLPLAISVYDRAFDPQGQPPNTTRTVYEFADRKVYGEGGLASNLLQPFRRSFFQPQLPSGWQRVVEDPANMAGGAAPNGQVPNSAKRQPAAIPR